MPIITGMARKLNLWQETGTHFSCVFPPTCEPDKQLVADVRRMMPEFVPIFMRRVFATPEGNEEYLDFVCAGRWAQIEDDPDRKPIPVERPANFPFAGGFVYHQRTLGTRAFGVEVPKLWKSRGIDDLPLRFDSQMVLWIKAAFHWFMNKSAKEAQADAMKQLADEQAARDKALDDLDNNASTEFVDKLGSPGMAKDAAFAMTKGPSVSVST